MKKTYGYARVSTREQHLDRQINALMDCGIDERDIVTDKATGATLERDGYQALKNTILREGDTLVIKSLDRLSRSKEHIMQELRYFKERHIIVRVIDLPTTMIQLPEGIAAAKERGAHLGRPGTAYPTDWDGAYKRWRTGELTAVAAMRELGLKRSTFYKLVRRYEEVQR